MTSSRRFQWLCILLLATCGAAVYSGALSHPFVFDDFRNITHNPHVRIDRLSCAAMRRAAFESPLPTRPLSNLSFAIEYYLHGHNVSAYRSVNIAIHIASGIFLFFLARNMFQLLLSQKSGKSTWATMDHEGVFKRTDLAALAGALLWLLHPVQTQSVTYIVQRMTILSAMFYIIAFWAYFNARTAAQSRGRWMFACMCIASGFLSFGSKENGATLPFMLIACEFIVFQESDIRTMKRILRRYAFLLLPLALLGFLYLTFQDQTDAGFEAGYRALGFSMQERLLTECRVVLYYVSLLFYPTPERLNFDYDYPLSHSLLSPFTTLMSLSAIIALFVLAIYMIRSRKLAALCIFWFFGNLVIESTIIPLDLVFEHRLYLPSMLLPFVFAAPLLSPRQSTRLQIAGWALLIAVAAAWTMERNAIWRSNAIFWRDGVLKSPNKARPWLYLGMAMEEEGDSDRAIDIYAESLRLDPKSEETLFNLGRLLDRQGRHAEAVHFLKQAASLYPESPETFFSIAAAYEKMGQMDLAELNYRAAIRRNVGYTEAYNNLGALRMRQGRPASAIVYFQKALQIDPLYDFAEKNLNTAFRMKQEIDDEIRRIRESLEKHPDDASLFVQMGDLFVRNEQEDKGIEAYSRALELKPDFTTASIKLAAIFAGKGALDRAIPLLIRATGIESAESGRAAYNLAQIFAGQGKPDEAMAWLDRALTIGFTDRNRIRDDAQFFNMRNRPDFKKLIEQNDQGE